MPDGTHPLAGTARQDYVPVGRVKVGFEPEEGAAERVAELSAKIDSDLASLKQQIDGAVLPWSQPWAEARSWGEKITLLREARARGLKNGARAWGNDQLGFFHEVGHALYEGAESAWDWYSDQSLIDQIFPLQAAERQLASQAAQEVDHLWNERDRILELFKKLRDQSVNGIELAIDALEDAPGQIGRIMAMLKAKGAAWVHGLIEACRQSDAINHVFATVGTILYSIVPPTVWVEGIATAEGYIIPEILLAILLVVIGAITEGADAGAIATQIGRFMATIEETFGKLGELGSVLREIKNGFRAIGNDIAELVRNALRNIEETREGLSNRHTFILRRSNAAKTGKFTPLGLDADPKKSAAGRKMIQELAKEDPNASAGTILDRARQNISAGKALPEVRTASTGEKLYKIVPEERGVGAHSPFFATESELTTARTNSEPLADQFGLPMDSERRIYSVHSVEPKPGRTPTIFESEVAPTVEGSVQRNGGRMQSIIPHRGDWTEPKYEFKIGGQNG